MLRKSKRLNGNTFKRVFEEGEFVRTPFFSAKVLKCGGDSAWFSFVVPKKLLKKPVQRNFVRRRGYHTLRQLMRNPHQPFYVIIFAMPPALELSFEGLKIELQKLLKKANFFK